MQDGERDQSRWLCYRIYVLAILTLITVMSYVDRVLPGIAAAEIKDDMRLSDTQFGVLSGSIFAASYMVCCLPLGLLADRRSRTSIATYALCIWSSGTIMFGMASNMTQLVLARMVVGGGEAGATPPGHALLVNYFPRNQWSRVLGVYGLGTTVGIAVGTGLGAVLVSELGWRNTFIAAGVTGLAIAVLFKLTVREPDRDAAPPLQGGPKSSLKGFFAVFGRPAFLLVCIGGACTGIVTSSKYFWLPSFFVRSYKLSIVEVGATLGMIQIVCGVCGTLLGSWLSDFFARKRMGAPARIAGLGSVMAGLAFAGMLLSGSSAMSFLLYVLVAFFERFHGGPLATAAQFLVGQRHRSTASSVLNVFAIGGGTVFGAAIVGFISDQLSSTYAENSLRYGMFAVSFIYFAGAVSFFAAARRMDGLLHGGPEAAE